MIASLNGHRKVDVMTNQILITEIKDFDGFHACKVSGLRSAKQAFLLACADYDWVAMHKNYHIVNNALINKGKPAISQTYYERLEGRKPLTIEQIKQNLGMLREMRPNIKGLFCVGLSDGEVIFLDVI